MKIDPGSRLVQGSSGHPGLPEDDAVLPSLPLEGWAATRDTLHLWAQVVGKIKLAYAPPKNHWWHVTLHLDLRGITTGRIPVDDSNRFEIRFDLVDHFVSITTNAGTEERMDLVDGLSVAAFDREIHSMLDRLGMDVKILESPYGVPMTTAFPDDEEHASYDRDSVTRFWRILDWSGGVFESVSGWFCGKTSPVQLYWHGFDLAFSRFNGARAPARPGADPITQEAYSHEVIAFGFWSGDKNTPEPSYYSYTAPEPPDLRLTRLPAPARWTERGSGSLALLPYEAVRSSRNPEATLTGFLQSAYEAGATAAGWDLAALESSWCPPPEELSLLATVPEEDS
ncbi:MAG TPA: DUF5996 family protein [Actinomycetota bacterium]|nr:DUF5996 family protein [Actinomycetota bacterium]